MGLFIGLTSSLVAEVLKQEFCSPYEKNFLLGMGKYLVEIKYSLLVLDLGNVQKMDSLKIIGHQKQVIWTYRIQNNLHP